MTIKKYYFRNWSTVEEETLVLAENRKEAENKFLSGETESTKEYYDSDTLHDSLIKEIFELTDDDYNFLDDEEWWVGEDIVYIYDVRDLTPSEFKTLIKLGILYE